MARRHPDVPGYHFSLASAKKFKVMSSRQLLQKFSVRKKPPGMQPAHDAVREAPGEAAIALSGSQPAHALGAVSEVVSGEAAFARRKCDAIAVEPLPPTSLSIIAHD